MNERSSKRGHEFQETDDLERLSQQRRPQLSECYELPKFDATAFNIRTKRLVAVS